MTRWHLLAGIALGIALYSVPASGADNRDARIAVHAQSNAVKGLPCPRDGSSFDPNSARLDCSDYTVEYPTKNSAHVYVVAGRADSVSGASFGIDYCGTGHEALGIFAWTSCLENQETFDGVNGPWPEPGSGVRLTGETCAQDHRFYANTTQMILGVFYMYAYSEDVFSIIANEPVEGEGMLVFDCDGDGIDLLAENQGFPIHHFGGRIQFGAGVSGSSPCWITSPSPPFPEGPQVDPCHPTRVDRITWGGIKGRYGTEQRE